MAPMPNPSRRHSATFLTHIIPSPVPVQDALPSRMCQMHTLCLCLYQDRHDLLGTSLCIDMKPPSGSAQCLSSPAHAETHTSLPALCALQAATECIGTQPRLPLHTVPLIPASLWGSSSASHPWHMLGLTSLLPALCTCRWLLDAFSCRSAYLFTVLLNAASC